LVAHEINSPVRPEGSLGRNGSSKSSGHFHNKRFKLPPGDEEGSWSPESGVYMVAVTGGLTKYRTRRSKKNIRR